VFRVTTVLLRFASKQHTEDIITSNNKRASAILLSAGAVVNGQVLVFPCFNLVGGVSFFGSGKSHCSSTAMFEARMHAS
jgi:hypothetical protein